MKRLAKFREIDFWDLGFFTLAKKEKKNYFLIIVFLRIMLRITNPITSTSLRISVDKRKDRKNQKILTG